MAITNLTLGVPGVVTGDQVTFGTIWLGGPRVYKPGGGLIKVAQTRDTGNTTSTGILRTGLMMAYNSTDKTYANWVIGVTTGALTGSGTSITVSAAAATELVRVVGSTGTFTLTGPEAAAGTTRQMTVTYSAVDTTTGVITITALGTNQVENVRFNIASTAGNLQLNVSLPNGTRATTANIAWSATDATYLASINSALDTTTGVVGGIVATAIAATDTDLGFVLTYSGTGYAGKTWPPAVVIVYPTSSTSSVVQPVTAAVQGAFIAGSVVSDTDYNVPVTMIDTPPNPSNMSLVSTTYSDWNAIPMMGTVNTSAVIDMPTDTSFRLWVQQQMSSLAGNKFEFSNVIGA
jgi:hypothetical protein